MLSTQTSALPRGGEYLDPAAFYQRFDQVVTASERVFFKLERLQSYDETGTPYHDAFLRGDLAEAVRLFAEQYAQFSTCDEAFNQRNMLAVRVRVVEFPLTDYLKWELRTYEQTVKFGQRILIADITGDPADSLLRRSSDFLMFDDREVLAHDYTRDGELRGAFDITDQSQVAAYREVAQTAIARSISLGAFAFKHPELFQPLA